MVNAFVGVFAMFNVRLIRPALAIGALLALGGCYSVPGAVGPMPYAPVSPVLGAADTASAGQVVGYLGTTCKAGFYICQVPPGPVGTECSCPGLGAPSFGAIR